MSITKVWFNINVGKISLLIPVDAFVCRFFETNFENKFLCSTILNIKAKIENKITDTCKHFYKTDFHVFS